MKLTRHGRTTLFGAIVVTFLSLAVFGGSPWASASSVPPTPIPPQVESGVHPLHATGCSGDVCIYLGDPSGGTVEVKAWASVYQFYGSFDLISEYSGTKTAGPQTWYAGGTTNTANYAYAYFPAIYGSFCVKGYDPQGTSYGEACEYIE